MVKKVTSKSVKQWVVDDSCKTHRLSYSKKYDAYYCRTENKWCENKCNDRFCEFCKNRPGRPVAIKKKTSNG